MTRRNRAGQGVLVSAILGDEHETCKIPDGRDVNQPVSHVRRVKANLGLQA